MRASAFGRIAALLSGLLLLAPAVCGCGEEPDAEAYGRLAGLVEAVNAERRVCADFTMEAGFSDPSSGEGGVLYFIDGEASCDRDAKTAYQDFRATLLGASSHASEYVSGTGKVHVENGAERVLEADADEVLASFPYNALPLPALADVKSLSFPGTGADGVYVVTADAGQKALLEDVWKLDLYALAGIGSPDREKESFGEAEYEYVVRDGRIVSLTVRLTAVLYEKTGYTPGYTPKDDDGNRLELSVRAKTSFVSFGEAVSVPLYGEDG